MAFAQKAFRGGRPLGIDIDPKKVERTKDAGFDAILADATIPEQFKGQARFSMLSHFLEHLPDYETVNRALKTAIRISREFVFIRQPWFDADGKLFKDGLKFYWSDWHGHPMTLTSLQMYRAVRPHLARGEIARATIFGNNPVVDTDNECIVPLGAPTDTGKYDPEAHGPKPAPAIELDAYKELVVVLAKTNPDITGTLLWRFPRISMIHDKRAGESSLNSFQSTGEVEDTAAGQAVAISPEGGAATAETSRTG